VGKAQRRPLELLKLLIACGGEQVPESRVTDALWPRIDGDSAHRSFTSALHRLRKLLGEDRAVVLHEGRLTLDRRYFWVDAWQFEALAEEIEAAGDAGAAAELGKRMLALYRGPFMAGEDDAAWLIAPRERLRTRLERALRRMPQDLRERIKLSVSEP
jgi:DNA-binding SARP family transcriptional activator